jgi:Zn-dependent peptidase ImmA (M78 family)/DNA-binding XRE family transcriptional regulator
MRPGTPGFIHQRLTEAREARAMTALTLADVVGVSPAAMSQYENNRQTPSPEVLRRISNALNVPVHRFMLPVRSREHGQIHFRCMSSATKRARLRATRRYEWLRELTDYIQRFIKFPAVNLPEFDVPSDPARISFDRIEEIATEVRQFYRLVGGPIGNMTGFLENHGVIVSMFDLEASTLDAFSEWAVEEPRPFVVLSPEKRSAVRSRFDAAHELGHMLLHRSVPKSALNQNDCFNLVEDQAHRFAGAFLLPAKEFCDALYAPSLEAMRSMKQSWRVAISAMIMRAADLGMIGDAARKKLFANMARRKWRTREPFDDELEVEKPAYLRRCVDALLERGMIGPLDMTAQTGIPLNDVEQLIGLPRGRLSGDSGIVEIIGDSALDSKCHGDQLDIIPFCRPRNPR